MPTVQEVLKESGWTDEEVKALDASKMSGLTKVVSTAQQALEAAELEKRSTLQKWDEEINPALNKWAIDSTNLTAERDYYKTIADKAKEGGFIPADVPFTPPTARAADGKFVAGANAVPGSPDFVKLRDDLGAAFAFAADTSHRYRTLYGTEMPDSPTMIIREATQQRMSPAEYAAKKYDFAGKEAQRKADDQKKHDDSIREAAVAEVTKKFAEQGGSNPSIRQAEASKFSTLDKAVKEKSRPDPLLMNREQRHASTRQQFLKEANERETTVQ